MQPSFLLLLLQLARAFVVIPIDATPGFSHNDYYLDEAAWYGNAAKSRSNAPAPPCPRKLEDTEGRSSTMPPLPGVVPGSATISRRDRDTGPPEPSPGSPPSMGDWWAMGVPGFLRMYVSTYRNSEFTAKHGLFGGLAHCYGLGSAQAPDLTNLTHGMPDPANDECVHVRKTLGTDDGDRASFTLAAMENFIGLTDLVHVYFLPPPHYFLTGAGFACARLPSGR